MRRETEKRAMGERFASLLSSSPSEISRRASPCPQLFHDLFLCSGDFAFDKVKESLDDVIVVINSFF